MKAGGKPAEKATRLGMRMATNYEDEDEDEDEEDVDQCNDDDDPWEFVEHVPNPDWCWTNNIENIEYNRRTGEYRYTTPDPWHEQYALA